MRHGMSLCIAKS